MKKEEKGHLVAALHEKFDKAAVVILVDYRGLNVEGMTTLRKKMRNAQGEFTVVKNTLAKKSAEGTAVESLYDHFHGPIAVALGYADPVSPARALMEFSQGKEGVKVLKGVLGKKVLEAPDIIRIAYLPSRDILCRHLVWRMKGPVIAFVMALQGVMGGLLRALTAIKDKKASS